MEDASGGQEGDKGNLKTISLGETLRGAAVDLGSWTDQTKEQIEHRGADINDYKHD